MTQLRLLSLSSSISFRATLAMVSMAVLGVVLTAIVGWYTLSREIDQSLTDKTNWSLRVAAEAFISYYPDYKLEYGANGEVLRLKGPAIADFTDHDAVDRITRINKGTATVFRFDAARNDFVRLTTSVKKADGTRAVGTVLGNTGVVFPVIMRGDLFKGVAHILGIPYQTGYMPIYSGGEKPSGILYIGVGKLEELRASTDALYQNLLIASGLVLAFAALCGLFIARKLVRPVAQLAATTERIAEGQIEKQIGFTERRDEIGQLARAVQKLGVFVAERTHFQAELETSTSQERARASMTAEAIE
ncbi:MAG: Cache 3/Cache 2 fusion domain-containing protein, partial [Bosea sp. (in: a-proteobacteria)]